jgi:hypothetical protein
MDCERFEAALIDELYNELDELTSAAAKRHAAGCSRCASLLGGLRATRRVAVLPLVEPSTDLEDRILAAARDTQSVAPVGRKISRAISWAGSWAMRPQTAMAAVFILMVGSSVLFVRRRKVADNATVTVTAQGAPAAFALPPSADVAPSLDSKIAAAAHGAGPVATYAAAPTASAPPWEGRKSSAVDDPDLTSGRSKGTVQNAQAAAGASEDGSRSAAGANALGQGTEAPSQAPLDHAKALYVAKDYVAATSAYDAIAANGDLDAALWAARSVRDGNGGCAIAKDRFDQIAARAWGTAAGYEATLEGGKCYRALGATDAAQTHYAKLLTVQQFAPLAQAEINTISQVAARPSLRKSMSKPAAASPNTQQAPSEPASSQQKMIPQKASAQ